MPPWWFEEIEINGGFLAGLRLRLPPGLTCVIGPRGSGKSTLAEALRYAVLGVPANSKVRQDLIQANLGPSSMVVVNTGTHDGPAYSIRRSFKQPAVVQTRDGRAVEGVELDRGSFLPLDAYTALEIEAIADESLGPKRRALLDDLRQDDLRQIHVDLSERQRALDANADRLRLAQNRLSDLKEHIEEASDVRVRLAAISTPDSEPTSEGYGQAVRQQQQNQKEDKGLSELATLAQDMHEKVVALQVQFSSFPDGAKFGLGSDNTPILAGLDEELRLSITSADPHFEALLGIAAKLESGVASALAAVRSAHAQQAAAYAELSRQNESANAQVRARAQLEEEVQKLEHFETDLLTTRSEIEKLGKDRLLLKGNLILAQDAISDLREEIAQELSAETGPSVRIAVARNADNFGYQQELTEGLRGARVRNHEDIVAKLMTVRPENLAQMIQSQDANSFERQMGFGPERSRKILEAYKGAIDPLDLEVVRIDDRVQIELNVSTESNPYFKDAAELSRGQKCTALLPLLLARRNCPLVADQPEDNLDNHFIYETVVKAIRRMRSQRQMVLVTHNANIPVLGEADLVVVMNSDGRIGYVEKTGSVDDCQPEIIDLLEGGREAFDLRSARYGREL